VGGSRASPFAQQDGKCRHFSAHVQDRFEMLISEPRQEAEMAEQVQILRLVRAFQKIKDQRRRRELVELAEASVEAEARLGAAS
jgi:hypothetical protein